MSAEARTVMLDRMAKSLKDCAVTDPAGVAAEWEELPRAYNRVPTLSLEAKLETLEDRLRDYDAEVTRVADHEVAGAITAVLSARGNRPTLLPEGFPAHWTPPGEALTVDRGFSYRELDRFDGVVTGAAIAIADTGSLVLQGISGQGRRATTLIPDFHLCVVRAEDVVQTVPEAFARLAAAATLPITFVSGPSATADIEMTRVKGVHGPRFLHVLLVSKPACEVDSQTEAMFLTFREERSAHEL